jgi:hypothetical protein
MRLRYTGTCVKCGAGLAKGEPAIYDPGSQTVHCLVCPHHEGAAADPTPAVDFGVAGRLGFKGSLQQPPEEVL